MQNTENKRSLQYNLFQNTSQTLAPITSFYNFNVKQVPCKAKKPVRI